jgi:hypothetical protein
VGSRFTSPVPLTTRRVRGVSIGTWIVVDVVVVGSAAVVVVTTASVVSGASVVDGGSSAAWEAEHADTASVMAAIAVIARLCTLPR